MRRIQTPERPDWRELAKEYDFKFHSMYGSTYWDESAYYLFSLKQIEDDLEDPTVEIHQMCLDIVDKVCRDEQLMRRFKIPEMQWDIVRHSWHEREPSLYSRLDFAYDGKSPAKLYENNADTPTSVYETGFWQWIWIEEKMQRGEIPADADQFNLLQEHLVERFAELAKVYPNRSLYFSCCRDSEEDRGTVQYLEDCAREAGLSTNFVFIEDIGVDDNSDFVDMSNDVIPFMFKLYPWEFMFREAFAKHLSKSDIRWLEPTWKSILSNKALLPLLWQYFPNHPNLLEAYFSDDKNKVNLSGSFVKKPIFSREGANIKVYKEYQIIAQADGPYGKEGEILQAYHPLPVFDGNHALVGSWLVNDKASGISIREDKIMITQDSSRYIPHIILD